MDLKQFREKRLRTEDDGHIYVDVRPFGEHEGDAIHFYLQETLKGVENGIALGPRKIVLICEPTSKIPSSVNAQLRQLNDGGISAEIRSQHRETTE